MQYATYYLYVFNMNQITCKVVIISQLLKENVWKKMAAQVRIHTENNISKYSQVYKHAHLKLHA